MSDKGAKWLATGVFASVAIAGSAWVLVCGHETAAIWMFVVAALVIAA